MELEIADRGSGIRLYGSDGSSVPISAYSTLPPKKYKPIPEVVLRAVTEPLPDPVEYTPPPALSHLKGYQVEGIREVIRHGGRRIIADEMGLGKTLQAIGVALYYRATDWPVLVICPSSVKEHWAREFRSVGVESVAIIHSCDTPDGGADVVILSYTIATKSASLAGFGTVIVDESHYIKNLASARSKCVAKACIQARRAVLLSGTPMNRPSDLFTQFRCVDSRFTHFHGHGFPRAGVFYFADRYCDPKEVFIRGGKKWRCDGRSRVEELNLVSRRYLTRRFKRDVLGGLPELERERVTLFSREKPAATAPLPADPLSDADFMEEVRKNCLDKVPFVVKYIRDVVVPMLDSDPSLKVIFFAHHRVMMDAIALVFTAQEHVRIDGSTDARQRPLLVDRYQSDPLTRVAVLSISATGVGLTMTAGSVGFFAELVFGPDQTSQAEARMHRIGQQRTVLIRYLVAHGTTDDVVWSILQNKTCTASQVLDNRKRFIQFESVDLSKKPRLEEPEEPDP